MADFPHFSCDFQKKKRTFAAQQCAQGKTLRVAHRTDAESAPEQLARRYINPIKQIMKRISTLIFSAALTALQAVPMAATAQDGNALKCITLTAQAGESSFSIAYPTGSEAVADSIRAVENMLLGGSYKGNLTDTKALRAHYAQRLATIDEGNGESATLEVAVAGAWGNAVTLSANSYFYGGGAHGIGYNAGLTFRKTDGARFGCELLDHFDQLRGLVARGLRAYFEVETDEEMLQCLQLEGLEAPESIDEIPAPETLPWVEGDSVVFHYNHYEIACYAAGEPTARLSLSEVWPWLSQEWRDALSKTAPVGDQSRQDEEWSVGAMNVEEQ